jgi:c-di-GMP-binding flagellar brake protein YcgR
MFLEWGDKLESEDNIETSHTGKPIDARKHSRFKLDVDVKIYPRDSSRVTGRTVDISEQGLAVMLQIEIPLDQVVRLEFELPPGVVSIRALVRQRNAFRYGFQFVEPDSYAQELIISFCGGLKSQSRPKS